MQNDNEAAYDNRDKCFRQKGIVAAGTSSL